MLWCRQCLWEWMEQRAGPGRWASAWWLEDLSKGWIPFWLTAIWNQRIVKFSPIVVDFASEVERQTAAHVLVFAGPYSPFPLYTSYTLNKILLQHFLVSVKHNSHISLFEFHIVSLVCSFIHTCRPKISFSSLKDQQLPPCCTYPRSWLVWYIHTDIDTPPSTSKSECHHPG